jgi:predicted ATPase/DNA-binding XRE family transcriptional regulator
MSNDQSFGDWLRQRRRALDLTQEEIARQVGCSAITLRKLEAEERRPSKQIAERLANVLKLAPDDHAAFQRFARGDPFAVPADAKPTSKSEPPETPPHNLPLQLTSFIGREKEIAQVRELLRAARLVTLTGPGGTGKTRLTLEAAAGLLDQYPDGAWLVELAPLADPALVPQTVATLWGLKDVPGRPLLSILVDHLGRRRLLLVLDNCEHLIQACAQMAEVLLRACPLLTILATSRETLAIAGESICPVPSLSLPGLNTDPSLEVLAQSEAARLFADRARVALPAFTLTADNASAVAQVCQQLDGMPLAIELAAARVPVLRVEQIAARLAERDRFRLLTSGSRTARARHQTLQALIDWSYDLLSPPEQTVLRRLAVFAGGWTLEAAEAVGSDQDEGGTLDELQQLANKSLVVVERPPGAEARYHLLETIRQYALAKLEAAGEADAARGRHAAYFTAKAETAMLASKDPWATGSPMGAELDNLRAALAWSRTAKGGADLGLRLAWAMSERLEDVRFREQLSWMDSALAHAAVETTHHPLLQARLLSDLGFGLGFFGDHASGEARLIEGLRLFRELGELTETADALWALGWLAREHDDTRTARLYLEESLALFRQLGDQAGTASVLVTLGEVAVMEEDTQQAVALIEEAKVLSGSLNDNQLMGWVLNHLGHVAQLKAQYARARRLQEESQALFRQADPEYIGMAETSLSLGLIALAQGDAALAVTHLRPALKWANKQGVRACQAWCLAGLGGAAVLDEDPERAARLWGAAEALRQSIGAREAPVSHDLQQRLMAAAREQMGQPAFDAAWAEGQAMTMEQAITLALGAGS